MSSFPNWFERVSNNFERILLPEAGKPGLLYLQLGCYTGDCSVWLGKNVLTGLDSRLFDVDTFEGSAGEQEHRALDWEDVFEVYHDRVGELPVVTFRMTTDDFFQRHPDHLFDFIYIDAGHRAENVLRDAVNADLHLRSGGILAFDDYWWGMGLPPTERPKEAIDAFFHVRATDYEYLERGQQIWARKR